MRFLALSLLAVGLCAQTATPTLVGGGVVARTYASFQLSSSASGCTVLYRCAWRQTAGTKLLMSDSTTATPTVWGAIPGEYTFQLIVRTVASGALSTNTITVGSVPTASNGVTTPSTNALFAQVIGSTVRLGQGAWPVLDQKQQEVGDLFGGDGGFQTTYYNPFWRTDAALPGTVTIATSGASTITGVGTSFLTTFSGYHYLIINYTDSGTPRFQAVEITSVDSDTQITIIPYESNNLPTGSGFVYGRATIDQFFRWNYPETNANYYDNSLGFRRLFARTGLTKYRTWARNAAQNWIEQPWFNYGKYNGGGLGGGPRLQALIGVMLLAEDTDPTMWTKLTTVLDYDAAILNSNTADTIPPQDARENWFAMWYTALAIPYHVNGAAYLTAVKNGLTRQYEPYRDSLGYWKSYPIKYDSSGFATTVNGSTAIVATGGLTFPSTTCTPDIIMGQALGGQVYFIQDPPNANRNGDRRSYGCTWVDSTHLSLDAPYEGTNSTTKRLQGLNGGAGVYVWGPGGSPFFQGIGGQTLEAARIATSATPHWQTTLPTWITGISTFLQTVAPSGASYPSVGGLYYGFQWANCPDTPTQNAGCVSTGEQPNINRSLFAETARAMQYANLIDPVGTPQAVLDCVVGNNFGGTLTGPCTSGGWTNEDLDIPTLMANKRAKNFGFYFGVGAYDALLAPRLGGYPGAQVQSRQITFGSPSGSTSIDVISAGATTPTNTPCPASPCTVSRDATAGGAYRIVRGSAAGGWIGF